VKRQSSSRVKRELLKRDPDEQTGTIAEQFREDLISYHAEIFTGLAMCSHYALVSTSEPMARAAAD